MNCPFCQKELSSPSRQCPYCRKEIPFTEKALTVLAKAVASGDEAVKNRDYRLAMVWYRIAVRLGAPAEVEKKWLLARQAMGRRRNAIRIVCLAAFCLSIAAAVLIGFSLKGTAPRTAPAASEWPAFSLRDLKEARDAFSKQEWEGAWGRLRRLSRADANLSWAIQSRIEESKQRYARIVLDRLLQAKKSGDYERYLSLLRFMRDNALDTDDETAFRLRRAEGLALFEKLDEVKPEEKERILETIVSLFRPRELYRIYYADDCLYELGVLKQAGGDIQGAERSFQLLLDFCPQGKWYWPAAKKRLAELQTSDKPVEEQKTFDNG